MKELTINPKRVKKRLVNFIKDEFKKRGYKRAILGISGGVDSASVAFLLTKALGKKNVVGLFLPYRTTDQKNKRDFKKIVKILGIKAKIIPITKMVDCYFKYFPKADRIRRGNKMARERMSILYDQSKVENALVVGSGNKTEVLLGYATIFGDAACAVNPVGDLYKTQLKQLARYMEVPQEIIKKTPSAGLWPGQSDEKELGLSYDKMDQILYLAIDKGYTVSQLIKRSFGKASVKKILDRVERFRFKSEPPAIAKLR